MVGKQRQHNKDLPKRLYQHGKKWRYCHKDGTKTVFTDLNEARRFAVLENEGLNDAPKTMRGLLTRYLNEVTPTKSARSREEEPTRIERLIEVFHNMRPDSVTAQHIYQYLDWRAKYPVSANHDIGILSHVFNKGIRWGMAGKNPCIGIERHEKKSRDRYVTDQEFWAVHGLANERVRLTMEFALITGLRRGDILALTRDNITDEGILVQPSKTKHSSGVALLIEWSDELHALVNRAKRLEPRVRQHLICTMQGKPYGKTAFDSLWQRTMRKATEKGIERFQFRDLRAKSASDDSLINASDRLGHSSTEITQRVYMRTPRKVKPLR